jgi:hypothetical protein
MLNVVMLSFAVLSVVMLNKVVLCLAMFSTAMLNNENAERCLSLCCVSLSRLVFCRKLC